MPDVLGTKNTAVSPYRADVLYKTIHIKSHIFHNPSLVIGEHCCEP